MGRGDIASLDVFYLLKFFSLIFIFPNDMPAGSHTGTPPSAECNISGEVE